MEPAGLTANWDWANGAELVPRGAGAHGDMCLSLTPLGGCSPTDFSARWKSAAHLSALFANNRVCAVPPSPVVFTLQIYFPRVIIFPRSLLLLS